MGILNKTDLIVNSDGSIYHLGLKPEQVPDLIFTVGDPQRVSMVSSNFDSIKYRTGNREFQSHIGRIGNQSVMVMSTGMGSSNIEIAINELDALVNFDLETRQRLPERRKLTLVRLGTSGSLRKTLEVGSILLSEMAVGFDSVLPFYPCTTNAGEEEWKSELMTYGIASDSFAFETDIKKYQTKFRTGITYTAPGFYVPQGRQLIFNNRSEILKLLSKSVIRARQVDNIEMETLSLYGLTRYFDHRALSFNAILANREEGTFSKDPAAIVDIMIKNVLDWVLEYEINRG